MSEKVSTEVVRRVFDDKAGHWLEVSPDADGLGCVRICATGKNAEYWGGIDFTLQPEFARAFAHAVLRCAIELQEAAKDQP